MAFTELCATQYREAFGRHIHAPVTTVQRGLWQTHPCPSHNSTERPLADTSMPQSQNNIERPLADTSMPQSQQYREASGKHIHAPVTTLQRGLWHTHPCHSYNSTERPLANTSMPQSQQYRDLWQWQLFQSLGLRPLAFTAVLHSTDRPLAVTPICCTVRTRQWQS